MARKSSSRRIWVVLIVGVIGGAAYMTRERWRSGHGPEPIPGVVHETEIRITPEISGRLEAIQVAPGQRVRKGELLAVLSSPDLSASFQEAKAAAAQASANRDNVFAGVRAEQIEISNQNVEIAESNLVLAQAQFGRTSTLAAKQFATEALYDQNKAALEKAEAKLASMLAVQARNKAGPTIEERANAAASVTQAVATAAVTEVKLAKTRIVSPVDGVVRLLVAEPGEIISPGQSVMTLEKEGERWITFTLREDALGAISMGSEAQLAINADRTITGKVTELRPLGEFATWRAARAVGDHDLNSFLMRVDLAAAEQRGLEPGMTVWLAPSRVARR